MLVYGDQQASADPRQLIADIGRRLSSIERIGPGLARHASLVAALVEAGRLQQGVADAFFNEQEGDAQSDVVDALGNFLLELGASVCRSWDSGYADLGSLPKLRLPDGMPAQIDVRLPEGFAFYALYPEAYIEAARRLKLNGPPQVIGIRSIGTALAPVVAAALDAPAPVTVRPFGDPSSRRMALSGPVEDRLLGHHQGHYLIVDEGPGQSGSSFAGVADWLRERGIPDDRIALLPSHPGAPGAAATESRRKWWRDAQRQVGDFGDRLPALVASWVEQALGPLEGPLIDVSAGAWRAQRLARQWPAVVPASERRKFLAASGGELILVKFAGLGRVGEEKLAIAQALQSENLAPEPLGLVHGFLLERWHVDARPLGEEEPLAEIARYIGTRARLLPATSDSGASIAELLRMASRNISLEFGDQATAPLGEWEGRERELEGRIVRVRTDNRMQPHKWLRTPAGRLLKTDALDHHQAHDLIGCQDVAWDAAGAIVEFGLEDDEAQRLVAAVEDYASRSIDEQLLSFYRLAYLAFRLGQMRLGETMTGDPEEQRRIRAEADRYAGVLHLVLQSGTPATRPESLVD